MFQDVLYDIVCKINEYLSNYILVFLLVGVGLWYSVKTRFVQVRCFGEGMRSVFGNLKLNGGKQEKGMSSFQALATAIAAQVGTGNIIGASGAILTGGPGAIFWMWIIAFFGMATIYAEAVLAQKTRIVGADGEIKGGPVYYITTAFKGKFGKFLAGFFAVSIILALGFMGCMVQSNSIGSTMETAFGIPSWIMGVILVVVCGVIFLGGVQRLAAVTEKIVPIMAGLFLLGGLVILVARIKYVPATIGMIFKYAFQPQAIIGGGVGAALKTAISQGAKRGLFSNEAGMGSTPHAHAQANVAKPHDQGVVAMIGVFIDTFVVLTLNALVIICTLYTEGGPLYTCGAVEASGLGKANLAQTAFGVVMGDSLGAKFVAICLLFFAFSTVLSWNMFGKINAQYLFKNKDPKKVTIVYTLIALVFVFLGTLASNDLVWELTDMFNNLIVLPNAIALFALTGMVVAALKEAKK
ncbi:MAG: sodium:alanine symporter family protein [Clostridiales bacterium]|nr:sodium:alanine symporter family protein [Candidatus Cacconaster stercorequi]